MSAKRQNGPVAPYGVLLFHHLPRAERAGDGAVGETGVEPAHHAVRLDVAIVAGRAVEGGGERPISRTTLSHTTDHGSSADSNISAQSHATVVPFAA